MERTLVSICDSVTNLQIGFFKKDRRDHEPLITHRNLKLRNIKKEQQEKDDTSLTFPNWTRYQEDQTVPTS